MHHDHLPQSVETTLSDGPAVAAKVLVFDDDESVGRLVVRVATLAGVPATAVARAEAFRQALRESTPQIVVLDLQLGETDGIEQVRYLAEQGFRGAVILMSGFDARVLDTAGALGRSLGLAVAGTLQKPVRVPALESLLQRVLADQRQPSLDHLLAGIRGNELVLEFQPIVTRRPRALRKLEALVRWEHPVLGRLVPADFLPLAESAPAAIDALTDWVFQAAIGSWRHLVDQGLRVPITVNVSNRNLHDLALPDRLEARLREADMPPEMLCLEITESAAFDDAARTMDVLSRLRLKGMELALDDFGTGYASLKLLRQMPFCAIKIDQSFVADMIASRDSSVIVKCIIDLATNMEMESVAEGVETEEVAERLEQMRVGALQGHLVAQPMPLDAVPAWLVAWRAAEESQAA